MKAAMGRLMAGVSRLMGGLGGALGKWVQAPGKMVMMAGKEVWQAGAWTLEKAADIGEYCVEAVDTAVGVTAQAAIHVGQDIGKAAVVTAKAGYHVGQDVASAGTEFSKGFVQGAGIATTTLGKLAWNNPVTKVARKVGRFMIEDNRPVINSDKGAKKSADNAVKAAKDMNPAELAKVKAEWVKNDPDLVREFAGADNIDQREAALAKMSPKARAWVSELQPTDLWAIKNKSAVEIAAHMAGEKAIAGLARIDSYYAATKAIAAAPEATKAEVPKDKTVTERRQERTARKLAKREAAANGGPQTVAGAVSGQEPTAKQQVMAFFGPKVAEEDEISPYSQAALPTPRPPVPMRKANG